MERQPPSGDSWPTVGIIVLNWESYSDTYKCLSSLEKVSYPNYECFVVDNGSTDGSGRRIEDEFEWVEMIYNEENLGAASGNNPGVKRALDSGVDYVLCLNEDTVLPPDFLHPLVHTMETNDRVAAVGGRQYNPDSGAVVNTGIWFIPILGGRTRVLKEPPQIEPYGPDRLPPDIAFMYVPTSMLLLNPDFLNSHDVFDESYFLGMEDVDLAYQARRDGWKVLVNPNAEIYHNEGLTIERGPFQTYHWTRNRFQFGSARLPLHSRIPFTIMLLTTLTWFCICWHFKDRDDIVRAALIGVGDYIADSDVPDYEFFS